MHGQVYCVCHNPNKGVKEVTEVKQVKHVKKVDSLENKIAKINEELARLQLLYDEADDYEVEDQDIRETLEEMFKDNIDVVNDYLNSKINTKNPQEYFIYRLNDDKVKIQVQLAHDAYDYLFQYGDFEDDLGYIAWTKYDGGHSTVAETFEGIIESFIKYYVLKV